MATGDFTAILCSLIMSLGCMVERNTKENNVHTETLPAMWYPGICNSKNSSNSGKSFHKDFLERVRNEAYLLNFLCSHSLENVRLNFLPLTFIFIVARFWSPGALSITRHITTKGTQDELSSWFMQEKLMHQSQPMTSQKGFCNPTRHSRTRKLGEASDKHLNYSGTYLYQTSIYRF